jgi:hypothetical protein
MFVIGLRCIVVPPPFQAAFFRRLSRDSFEKHDALINAFNVELNGEEPAGF